MKLQPESKKELLRIAGGTAFCTAIMWVLFAALHLVGWVKFDDTVVLGSLVGAAVAIGNFAGICFVVQKIIDEPDEKRRKATLQLSYNSRMLLQALWVVVAVAAPCFQPFASVLPLVMCLGGCWWAVSHWGWPMWVYLPAVLLGLAAGAQNFWVFVKERLDRSKKDKPRRTGFNSHL